MSNTKPSNYRIRFENTSGKHAAPSPNRNDAKWNGVLAKNAPLEVSRYNYFSTTTRGHIIGFNAAKGSFALLTPQTHKALSTSTDVHHLQCLDTLITLGFVHYGDEFIDIQTRYKSLKERNDRVFVTIAPTMACNLCCPYCFQMNYQSSHIMDSVTATAVLNFIETQVKNGRKEIACDWYGGEPLLAKDILLFIAANLNSSFPKKLHYK